jgi:hypothetical protein
LDQRKQVIEKLKELALAARSVSDVEVEAEQRALQARVDLLRLQAQELELRGQIEQQQALQSERLQTEQLAERRKRHEIRVSILPPSPESPSDPHAAAVAKERARLRAGADAEQAVIADCLRQVRRVFRSKAVPEEKALRIKAVLSAYNMEPADLPAEIADFLIVTEEMARV